MEKRDKKEWKIRYGGLTFKVSPTGFKHTGLFPEQAVNWDFMAQKIRAANRPVKVLNLLRTLGAPRWPVLKPALQSAMWTPPRGWWHGPGKTPHFPDWGTSLSAGL